MKANTCTPKLITIAITGLAVFAACSMSIAAKKPVHKQQIAKKTVQKAEAELVPPINSICICNFTPDGDQKAKAYAVGFQYALQAKLFCAPTSLTLQVSANEINQELRNKGINPESAKSDALVDVGKRIGVRYLINGTFSLNGDRADVIVHISDMLRCCSFPTIRTSGTLTDLPNMQANILQQIVKATKLKLTADQVIDIKKPSFANPDVLMSLSKIINAKDSKDSERYIREALDSDPQSINTAVIVLGSCIFGPSTKAEILSNQKLQDYIDECSKRFPENSNVAFLKASLLAYKLGYIVKAQEMLTELVKKDPRLASAHESLAQIAEKSNNYKAAVSEYQCLISLWPTRAQYHQLLSNTYIKIGDSVRQGRFYSKMSADEEKVWGNSSALGFKEAKIAAKLDPDCGQAWMNLLYTGRGLGQIEDVHNAFKQLIRLNPKNYSAYLEYAFTFSPQWYRDPKLQENVLKMADNAFGKDSEEAPYLRATVLARNIDRDDHIDEILQLADKAIKNAKHGGSSSYQLKLDVLMYLKRENDALEVAKKANEALPNTQWRQCYANLLQGHYEQTKDVVELNLAADLLASYIKDCPNDINGHLDHGWCLDRQGKHDQARDEYLNALKLEPTNKVATDWLAANEPKLAASDVKRP